MIPTADVDLLVAELRALANAGTQLADRNVYPKLTDSIRAVSEAREQIADRLAAMNSRSAS